MNPPRCILRPFLISCLLIGGVTHALHAQTTADPYQPQVGQPGKDVVWVPTPPELVEKMLDMARVTSQDFVVDLGSGDGRNVIAAAKRGARAMGVEYNPDMVALSKRHAEQAGVGDKATFVQGDMYEADFSQATVLALFLLPENLRRLTPKFLALKPGTRIVGNTFGMPGWNADETERIENDCSSWCTALLWIVPAKVEGAWRPQQGELTLKQDFQIVTGTWSIDSRTIPIENGKLHGDQISFTVGGVQYSGRVSGDSIEGTLKSGGSEGAWKAARLAR